jgi:hypothetical protein
MRIDLGSCLDWRCKSILLCAAELEVYKYHSSLAYGEFYTNFVKRAALNSFTIDDWVNPGFEIVNRRS